MLRNSIVVLSIVFLIVVLLPVSSFGSSDWQDRPGTVEYTLGLPDHQQVTLDGIMVDRVIGDYVFVKDSWAGSPVLPVFTNAQVKPGWTIEIQGYTLTVSGTRIVVAQQVRLYLDSHGKELPPFPLKYSSEPINWPYMLIIPSTSITSGNSQIPAPTDPSSYPSVPVALTPAPEGTVAAAKINENNNNSDTVMVQSSSVATTLSSNPPQLQTGSIQLIDKVVTAVFYAPNTQAVTSFYIQEPTTGGNGIKIIPQVSVPVEPGNMVTVTGRVVASDTTTAECHISASKVTCSGSTTLPKPVGTQGRWIAGGIYGRQQALYIKTEDQSANPPRSAAVGSGLTLVGTRIRLWGKVTWVSADSTVCFIDDGSGFKSNYSGAERSGVRIMFPQEQPTSYQLGNYVSGITGVLGAELSEDTTPQPVPVLRVSRVRSATSHIWYVRPSPDGDDTTHTGDSWEQAFATVQKGINSASAGDEVWVAAGTYSPQASESLVSLKPGVNLYGGFCCVEYSKEERNWVTNATILDCTGIYQPVVKFSSSAESIARIDGFTISKGYAFGYYNSGGGIYSTGSVIIANNTISNNKATISGGGVYCSGNNPIIWNNTICGNTVSTSQTIVSGGGIFTNNSSALIMGNIISDNTLSSTKTSAIAEGGGICCISGSPKIMNNTIINNTASTTASNSSSAGGGIYCQYSTATIFGNQINDNKLSSPLITQATGIALCALSGTGYSQTILNNEMSDNIGYCSTAYISGGDTSVANNVIYSNSGTGMQLNGGTLHVINNTIVFNNIGASFSFTGNSPVIANNIIAFNTNTGIVYSGTGTPTVDYNCVYNPGGVDYSGLSAGEHDITGTNANPNFLGQDIGDFHIAPNSPCVDKGYDTYALDTWVDMDFDIRKQGAHVDIGADETGEYSLTLTPTQSSVACQSLVTLTALLIDSTTQQPIPNTRVNFVINSGSISSITPDGHLESLLEGWGTTNSDGNVSITIMTPADPQTITVTATVPMDNATASAKSIIYSCQYRVGFLYGLCIHFDNPCSRDMIDSYLTRIDSYYPDITYDRILDIQSGINGTFNVVVVAIPSRPLLTSELNALWSFVSSGRNKRIVLIGEHKDFATYNGYLNGIAEGIQMNSRFGAGYAYDPATTRDRLCDKFNASHYLMSGIVGLWMACTDTFLAGWDSYARPVCYIKSAPASPWIIEEDTTNAGSRIAIHDTNIMDSAYNDIYDLQLNKNFKFIYNLCTIFPQ